LAFSAAASLTGYSVSQRAQAALLDPARAFSTR
jgi:hypothetical protein